MNNAYYLVLFLLIFSHYCSLFFNQRNNKIFDLHIFFLILFIGFRHKVGGDWGTYQGLLFENKYLTLSEFFSTVTLNSFGYNGIVRKDSIKIENHTFTGSMWIIGWLFTIGFLHLSFWWGVLAVIIWPYLLGVHFAG